MATKKQSFLGSAKLRAMQHKEDAMGAKADKPKVFNKKSAKPAPKPSAAIPRKKG